jgi:predicted TIM-barrel fold metal-dependent hydrolase
METAISEAPFCLPPRPMSRRPNPLLPAGTCDCHFHAFSAGAPLNTPRSYTPQIVTLADWRRYADAAGIDRGVLVQPSVYGYDNNVLLEALATDPERLRGIAVLPSDTPIAALRRLDQAGVRGVRINTRNKGGLPLEAVSGLAGTLADLNWSLQFQVNPDQLPLIAGLAPRLGLPVVLDHLGFIALGRPETKDHVTALQRLLDQKGTYVKLSAPYRLSGLTQWQDFGAVAARLAASHPHRLLWGSDWPHTELWGNVPDDAELVETTQSWLADGEIARQMFVANAQSLFFSR